MHKHVTFAAPGSLDTLTGGFLYGKCVVAGLRARDWTVDVLDVGTGFPLPGVDARQRANDLICCGKAASPIIVDGLALGALPEAAETVAAKRPLIGLVHHPLFLEAGHDDAVRDTLFGSEKSALSFTRHVITTSRETSARVAADFSYPCDRITAIEPGIVRPATFSPWRETGQLNILSVGTLVPRKGHHHLIKALAKLRQHAWTLTIVGSPDLDTEHAKMLKDLVTSFDLEDRIRFAGKVSDAELSDHYRDADLFALASDYEGYGIAYAEAVLHGLPVIGTTGGAIKNTVPAGTGILTAPGDADALLTALTHMISQPDLRRKYSECARKSGSHFQTWEAAACSFELLLEDFL